MELESRTFEGPLPRTTSRGGIDSFPAVYSDRSMSWAATLTTTLVEHAGGQLIKKMRSPTVEPRCTKYETRAALTSRSTRSIRSAPTPSRKWVLTITREFGFAAASRLTSIRCLMAHSRVIKCMSMHDLSLSQSTVVDYGVYACVQQVGVGAIYQVQWTSCARHTRIWFNVQPLVPLRCRSPNELSEPRIPPCRRVPSDSDPLRKIAIFQQSRL